MVFKSTGILLTVILLSIGIIGPAQAIPMLYTFQGEVTALSDDAGFLSDANVTVGTGFSYKFIVDFNRDGTADLYNGSTSTFSDNTHQDYFYSSLLSKSIVTSDFDLSLTDPDSSNISNYNTGFTDSANSTTAQLFAGSSSHLIEFMTQELTPFTVGAEWRAFEFLRNGDTENDRSHYFASMTLSKINSVPEPPITLLLASGLIGLIAFTRRKT